MAYLVSIKMPHHWSWKNRGTLFWALRLRLEEMEGKGREGDRRGGRSGCRRMSADLGSERPGFKSWPVLTPWVGLVTFLASLSLAFLTEERIKFSPLSVVCLVQRMPSEPLLKSEG